VRRVAERGVRAGRARPGPRVEALVDLGRGDGSVHVGEGEGHPASARLVVTYGEQTREVDRPGFIIGRGKQASGLTIKDPNISRCHATIEQQDGVYYLVDMGSTNGTQVNGQGIQRKPIVEGDVARICDHEIRFSYRRMP